MKISNQPKFIFYLIPLFLGIVVFILYIFLKPTIFSRLSTKITYVQFCEVSSQCQVTNLPYQDQALPIDSRVDDLLGRMTLAEKIGQMALIEKNSITDLNDIALYGLGGLMSGGGAKPKDNTPQGWWEMVNNFQSYSQKTRLAIPLLYGVDANHGHSNVFGATIFPHAIGLGASKDADLVKAVAQATAQEVLATGINWVFSPNLDVVVDTRWGRTYETFGSDPALVSLLGQAYIDGMQSANQDGVSLAAGAKHYVGNGSTVWGSSINKDFFIDQGNSDISEPALRATQLVPFTKAVAGGVKSVMAGLNTWHGEKVTTDKYLLTDVLRDELGFQGFVFSDWYGVYEKEPDKYKALVRAINAGIDMVMLPFDYKFFSLSMQRAVAKGDIDQKRVDEAVRRILKVKFEIGLFDRKTISNVNLNQVGSQAHRDLARQAVRESLVLLKNDKVVPISKNIKSILVAGSAAHNLGKQSGGWTMEWQGVDGNWIPGTTILQGLQNIVSPKTTIKYDQQGNFDLPSKADVGIAIVGESPYAEGWGDNENPQLSPADLEAITNLKSKSKKIIVIIVSGRPLNIKAQVNNWDALIAAWLPSSEGQGVADVLFGDYEFTGTLPVVWDL
jgi:beta-glucosidase